MFYLTIVLFGIAALFGVIILKNWLTSANTSRTVVYSHGAVAALALILLFVHVTRNPSTTLKTGLGLFVIAALGGFYMFFRDMKGKYSPTWMAVTHGLLAVAGVVSLLLTVV